MRTRALAIAIGVVLPALALAKPKVAVVQFDGDSNGQVQDVVADLLEEDYAVTGPKQVNRALNKLGFEADMTDKQLKKLANELEADAIVRGDLSQSGKRKLLHVRLFLNGKRIRGFKVEFASVKSEKFKDALKTKMLEKLSGEEKPVAKKKKGEEAAEPAADEEDPTASKKGKKKKKGEEDVAAAEPTEKAETKKKKKGEEEESGEATGDEEKTDEDDAKAKKRTARADGDTDEVDNELTEGVEVEPKSQRGPNVPAVRLDVGGSGSTRSLRFNSRPFEEAPNPYSNSLVGGARVAGELYPLAFGNPYRLIAGLGIGGHYDQTLKLGLRSTAQPDTEFPVTQRHWSVGLRIRIAFGSRPTSPTLTLGGGYFQRMFVVDRSQLMAGNILDLPDIVYKGFDPGLEVRIPIIRAVAFVFGGKAMLVTSAGPIQQPDSYGQAKVTAAEVMVGADIMFTRIIGMRLIAEGSQYGFAFTGNGEQARERDHDPSQVDVGGAADRYLGFAGSITVLY